MGGCLYVTALFVRAAASGGATAGGAAAWPPLWGRWTVRRGTCAGAQAPASWRLLFLLFLLTVWVCMHGVYVYVC